MRIVFLFIGLLLIASCDVVEDLSDPELASGEQGRLKVVNKTKTVRLGWIYIDEGPNELGSRWITPGKDWSIYLKEGSYDVEVLGDIKPYDGEADVRISQRVRIIGGITRSLNVNG